MLIKVKESRPQGEKGLVAWSWMGRVQLHPNERRRPEGCGVSTPAPQIPANAAQSEGLWECANPPSSGSTAIQNQVLYSEVRARTGEEKDLIPRKCSTNLPARCGELGLPASVPGVPGGGSGPELLP